jgi:hypothetical protein
VPAGGFDRCPCCYPPSPERPTHPTTAEAGLSTAVTLPAQWPCCCREMESGRQHRSDTILQFEDGPIPNARTGHERDPAKFPDMAAVPVQTPEMSQSPFSPSSEAVPSHTGRHDAASNPEPPTYTSTQTTVVELLSSSATSSAFPESFGLSVSLKGRWVVAYSSSALYILSVQHLPAYQSSCRAFRIRRKPLAVAITDVGKFAVLTTPHKIDIYHCGEEQGDLLSGQCKKLETVYLNTEARTVAFSHCGEVVAAGSDTGIEIRNLSEGSLETDKRQINCASVEYLAFSENGRSILATASARRTRVSTFVSVNGVYEDALLEDNPILQPLGKVWITQLLFPERINARQAVFLPDPAGSSGSEVLAFDSHADRYSIFDVPMKRFSGQKLDLPDGLRWSRSDRIEDALPAVTCDGSYAAVAVRTHGNREVWAYYLPPDWRERGLDSNSANENDEDGDNVAPLQRIQLPAKEEGAPPENITCLRWMQLIGAPVERLVVLISTVTLSVPEEVVPSAAPAASGKIMLFDFKRTPPGVEEDVPETVTIDLDDIPLTEGLADEVLELDREVDIVRRRTQVQRQRPDLSSRPRIAESRAPRRSMSSGSTGSGLITLRDLSDPTRTRSARRRRSFSSISTADEEAETGSIIGPVDEPYSQSQPRSQFSLQRAATISANAPANRSHLLALPSRPLEYRRADGLREMPHESDADNWVPPPPPYTAEPDNATSLPISANPQAAAAYVPPQQERQQRRRSQQNSTIAARPQQAALPLPQHVSTSQPSQHPPVPQPAPRSSANQTSQQSSRSQSSRPAPANRSANVPSTASPPAPPPPSSFNLPVQISHVQVETNVLGSQSPLRAPSVVTRRPVGADSARSPLGPPAPGFLNSPMTFPPTGISPRHSPRGSASNILITRQEHLASSRSHSSPSSPVTRADSRTISNPSTDPSSPLPSPPSADQMTSLHRRSGSAGSIPRAARGAIGAPSTSIDLMRPLPPPPPAAANQRIAGRNSNYSAGRRDQRPHLNRLTTIASADDRHPAGHDEIAQEQLPSTHTTPETPTSRTRWWKLSGPKDQPQRPHTAPPTRSGTPAGARPKEGGMRCIVM